MSEEEQSVRVNDVLEAVADTVLQMVLFQVEAKENESTLVKLDVAPLLGSIKFLVDLAQRKAAKWTETEEKKNQQMMLKACSTMAEATEKIDSSLEVLREDPFDDVAKDDMLWAARTVVQSTVALLQLADNYDIRKLIRGAKNSQKEQDKLLDAGAAELPDVLRQFVYETVNLAKQVEDRINYIEDPVLRKKFDQANTVVREKAEPLIHAHVATLQNPDDEESKEKEAALAKELSAAYKKLIAIAKISSQEMFAGIDLNLNPLDDDDKLQAVDVSTLTLDDACRRIIDLAGNGATPKQCLAAVRDAQTATQRAIEEAKEAIANETDPEKKQVLEAALVNLENNLRNLTDAARVFAKQATPENSKKLASIAAALMDAGDAMQQAIEMPDHLDKAANRVQIALATLADAVKFAAEPACIAAAKGVQAALQDQVNLAQQDTEKDPKRAKRLNQAVAGQPGIMRNLLTGTKGVVDARDTDNAGPKWDTFNTALDDVAAYSQRIADLSDPARAARFFQTPEDLLTSAVTRVNEALADLQKDPGPETAQALEAVADAVNAEMGMAKAMKSKRPNEIATGMAGQLSNLIKASRANMQDPDNYQNLDDTAAALKDLQVELVEESVPIPHQVVSSVGELREHCAQLLDAVDAQDKRGAAISLEDVQRDLAQQIHAIEATPADGAKRAELDKLKAEQSRLAEKLPAAVDDALADPNDDDAFATLEAMLEEAQANALKIAEVLVPDVEHAAVEGAARLNSAERALVSATNAGNEEAADAARRIVDNKLRQQAVLADLLAAQAKDDQYKQRLIDASKDLADILRDLFPAVEEGLDGDMGRMGDVYRDTKDANKDIVSGISDPASRMEALGQQINALIDSLDLPYTEAQQAKLVDIVNGLEQQVVLANVVADRHPERADAIQRALANAEETLDKLKPAIIEALNDPDDQEAQNFLEDLMEDAREDNNELVEAAQPELFDRILGNVEATEREMGNLDAALSRGDQQAAKAIAVDIEHLQQKQAQLLRSAGERVGPKLAQQMTTLSHDVAQHGGHYARAAHARLRDPKDWKAQTNYNRNGNQLKKTNKAIREAIEKAKRGGDDDEEKDLPTAESWAGGGGGLRDAAVGLRKATRELKVDDTPKGKMFAEAQKIAEAMQRLAASAASDDKAGMVQASKDIATYTQNVVKIAKTIEGSGKDKDYLMSCVLGAKGTSVQLKILAAVKASIVGKDKTAEGQLITCASNLAQQVTQGVNAALACEIQVG